MSSVPEILRRPAVRRLRKRRRFLIGREPLRHLPRHDGVEFCELALESRPRTRAECQDGPRPCPWVGCRYHLYLDTYTTGDPDNPTPGLIIHHPDVGPLDLPETCLLDIACRGPLTLAQIGELFDLSRERIRQIEASALRKLSRTGNARDQDSLARILETL